MNIDPKDRRFVWKEGDLELVMLSLNNIEEDSVVDDDTEEEELDG